MVRKKADKPKAGEEEYLAKHLEEVKKIAWCQLRACRTHIQHGDLVQVGLLALLTHYRKKGPAVNGLLYTIVKRAIALERRKHGSIVSIPAAGVVIQSKVARHRRDGESLNDLSSRLGVPLAKVKRALGQLLSVSTGVDDWRQADGLSPHDEEEIRQSVSRMLGTLPKLTADVMARLFGLLDHEAKPLPKVARDLGLPRSYVTQLRAAALLSLRDYTT